MKSDLGRQFPTHIINDWNFWFENPDLFLVVICVLFGFAMSAWRFVTIVELWRLCIMSTIAGKWRTGDAFNWPLQGSTIVWRMFQSRPISRNMCGCFSCSAFQCYCYYSGFSNKLFEVYRWVCVFFWPFVDLLKIERGIKKKSGKTERNWNQTDGRNWRDREIRKTNGRKQKKNGSWRFECMRNLITVWMISIMLALVPTPRSIAF